MAKAKADSATCWEHAHTAASVAYQFLAGPVVDGQQAAREDAVKLLCNYFKASAALVVLPAPDKDAAV